MWQLFIASFCDQTDIEGNGRQQQDNKTTTWQEPRSLSKQVLLKLKNSLVFSILVEMMTPKGHFEINWTLIMFMRMKLRHCNQLKKCLPITCTISKFDSTKEIEWRN